MSDMSDMSEAPVETAGGPRLMPVPLCTELLENLRGRFAGVDALAHSLETLVRQLPRLEDPAAAVAIRRIWVLAESVAREARESVEFTDHAITRVMGRGASR